MKIHTILSVLALSLVAGCTKDSKAEVKPAPITTEMAAKLEKADAADGKTDKVVSKCIGCDLKMEGQEKNALKVGEYSLHMCDGCYTKYKDDPSKSLAAM